MQIDIPDRGDELGVSLNRQDVYLYEYHNLTRLAAIFSHILLQTSDHNSVDDIFKRFTQIKDPQTILTVFIKDFRKIYYLYIQARFDRLKNLCFQKTVIENKLMHPIYSWFTNGVLFTSYSEEHLKSLINKSSAFIYLYGINNIVINAPLSSRGASKRLLEQQEDERILAEKTRIIAKSFKSIDDSDINATLKDVYTGAPRRCNSNVAFGATRYSADYRLQLVTSNVISADHVLNREKYVLDTIHPIQKNIREVYSDEYGKHLVHLSIVYYILETAIRPLIEELTKSTVDETVLTIDFTSGVRDKNRAGLGSFFTHGTIGTKRDGFSAS